MESRDDRVLITQTESEDKSLVSSIQALESVVEEENGTIEIEEDARGSEEKEEEEEEEAERTVVTTESHERVFSTELAALDVHVDQGGSSEASCTHGSRGVAGEETQVDRGSADVISCCADDDDDEDVEDVNGDERHRMLLQTASQQIDDSDYDTDLEMNDDQYLHPEKYDHDTTGRNKYLKACRDLDVQPIRYFAAQMGEHRLKLRYHGLGPAAIKAMCVPLESNTCIEQLDLEGNWLLAEGTVYLCRVLKDNVYLTELNLSENKIEMKGAVTVCRLLMDNRTIERLELAGNCIGDSIGEILFELLTKNPVLKRMNLSHNHLEDNSAQWLRDALLDNCTLEYLNVSWNHFQSRGCVLLAEGLAENIGLKELSVAMNGFGEDGGIALGEALKENRTLLRLDASFCRLPLDCAGDVGSGLEANEALQYLNLAHNTLKAEGAFTILSGLGRNDTSVLKLLNLGNIKVFMVFKELQDRLEAERELEVIHGGVIGEWVAVEEGEEEDPWTAFCNDPFTKLKEWVEKVGYRLLDVMRTFDKDQSMTISREEFRHGIENTNIDITEAQIQLLMDRLDRNGDGEIDYSPLLCIDEDEDEDGDEDEDVHHEE